jgi:hypothetical protein
MTGVWGQCGTKRQCRILAPKLEAVSLPVLSEIVEEWKRRNTDFNGSIADH